MGFLLFYRVEGMVIKNTTKPSPEQLRRGSAFDHIKCHRQVWNTWGGRESQDVILPKVQIYLCTCVIRFKDGKIEEIKTPDA